MKPYAMSRSSLTMNNLWKARGRRPTLRRTCKVFIPCDLRGLDMLRVPASYEEDNFCIRKLKTITRHKLHHWILVIAISCYLYAGAILFQHLELNYGKKTAFNMSNPRESFFQMITNNTKKLINYRLEWEEDARKALSLYEFEILHAAKQGYNGEDISEGLAPYWKMEASILYCLTVITTIGYGNIAPSNDISRIATIIYAFLGIPLMVLVLADLGKLFTKAIKFVFRYVCRFYKTGTFKKTKGSLINHHKKPLQYMTVSWRTVTQNSDDPSKTKAEMLDTCNQVTTLTLHNDDVYKDLDFMNAEEANHKHVEMEDDFNLPVTLAVAMVLAYMIIGAKLFSIWEEWTFFESFYFVFISMSTIGFGDYVPSNEKYMMGMFIYLVLGLTLTSMCINVIQEKLVATFQKAKVCIGSTTGLDVNTLLNEHGQKHAKYPYSEITQQEKSGLYKNLFHKNGSKAHRISSPQFEASEKPPGQITAQANPQSELLLSVPIEKRFTFYDSPYSTIQNENLYNTVSSISSLNVS